MSIQIQPHDVVGATWRPQFRPGEWKDLDTKKPLFHDRIAVLTEKNTRNLEKLATGIPKNQEGLENTEKKRRAQEVLAVLEASGPKTYEQLRNELKPAISYNRITALVSEMIRDGIDLKREGKPVRVSFEGFLTGSN